MDTKTPFAGQMVAGDTPDWKPLEDLAAQCTHPLMTLDDWMWMYAVEAENGRRLHAYKHYWTRRYVHLDDAGRGYAYIGDHRYREVDPLLQVDEALEDLEFLYYPPRDGSRPVPADADDGPVL